MCNNRKRGFWCRIFGYVRGYGLRLLFLRIFQQLIIYKQVKEDPIRHSNWSTSFDPYSHFSFVMGVIFPTSHPLGYKITNVQVPNLPRHNAGPKRQARWMHDSIVFSFSRISVAAGAAVLLQGHRKHLSNFPNLDYKRTTDR